MVDNVLAQEKDSGHVDVYVDDILVHTPDLATNRYWTGRVLSKLAEHHLHCWKEKCQFEKDKVEFLRVLLGEGSIRVSPRKVQAIWEERVLKNRKGVRRFLGITNYHRRFIKDYLTIARPLHNLTRDIEYIWTEDCQLAFEKLKKVLMMVPVLALPSDGGKFRLEADVSDVAMGVVLYQEQEDGTFRLVSYSPKSYNDVEKSYTTYDKEMLAIMRALEEW
jgi:hypothetical protein